MHFSPKQTGLRRPPSSVKNTIYGEFMGDWVRSLEKNIWKGCQILLHNQGKYTTSGYLYMYTSFHNT